MSTTTVEQGDIWRANLDPTEGQEQQGTARPVLVISNDDLHQRLPTEIAWILPMTRTDLGVPNHVEVESDEYGIRETSYVMCEQIRTVSLSRFRGREGSVSDRTLSRVRQIVGWFLE